MPDPTIGDEHCAGNDSTQPQLTTSLNCALDVLADTEQFIDQHQLDSDNAALLRREQIGVLTKHALSHTSAAANIGEMQSTSASLLASNVPLPLPLAQFSHIEVTPIAEACCILSSGAKIALDTEAALLG